MHRKKIRFVSNNPSALIPVVKTTENGTGFRKDCRPVHVFKDTLIKSKDRVRDHGEVFTPGHIVDEMIALIPDSIWSDPERTTLEPTCGNGNFIIAIIKKKMSCGQTLMQALNNTYGIDIMPDNVLEIYERIFKEFLTGPCRDEDRVKALSMALYHIRLVANKNGTLGLNLSKISKCFPSITGLPDKRIRCIQQKAIMLFNILSGGMISNKEVFLSSARKCILLPLNLEKEIGMTIATDTFDVVIGNPPYQEEDGGYGASAKPLYHKFIEMAIDKISPQYLSFIIPSRWMAGGKGLDSFRARMKKDKRLKIIRRFYDKIFENVEIKGGVCYFLWDKNYSGLCSFNNEKRDLDKFDIIVRDNISEKILEKVILKNFPSLGEKVSSRSPFGLSTNFQDWDKNGLICYARKRSKHYITKEKIPRINNSFGFWKVLAAKASGDSFLNATHNKGFRNIFIAEPNEVSTDTYIVLNWFGTKNEAENFYKYTQTKFFQALLSTRVISQQITKEKFSFIPDLKDYTKVWTDKELYEMFDLTEEEIDHIEISIKSLAL